MSTDEPDRTPPNRRDGDGIPVISIFWALLIFLVGSIPLALAARGLHFALDLPKDSELVRPALWIVLITVILTRPETFRHRVIVAAVGIAVGAVAMLCFLPITVFAEDFEIWSQRSMLRLLATLLVAVLGVRVTWLACRRWSVPLLENSAKDPPSSNAS